MNEAIILSIIIVYCKVANSSPIVHIIITSHFTQNVNFVAAILIIVSTVYQARSIHFVSVCKRIELCSNVC